MFEVSTKFNRIITTLTKLPKMIKEVKNFSRLPRGCKVPFYQFASLCLATDYHSATFMCKWFHSILLYQTNWSSFEQIMGRSGMDTIGSVRIPTSFVTQFSPNSTLLSVQFLALKFEFASFLSNELFKPKGFLCVELSPSQFGYLVIVPVAKYMTFSLLRSPALL